MTVIIHKQHNEIVSIEDRTMSPLKIVTRSKRTLIQPFKWMISVAIFVTLAGCSVTPKPLSDGARTDRVAQDLEQMFADQTDVSGPITIGEAIARALKYNLDHRLKEMEAALAQRNVDFSKTGLLPRVVANAGYSRRDNSPGARSIDLETGEESLPPSQSTERTREFSDIVLTWNVLDFGMSYYTAKQTGNEVLIAEERKRKTIQNISQDVIDAYWKAWMSQGLAPKIDMLLAEVSEALEKSEELVKQGVQDSEQALGTQARLLSTMNSLIEMRERIGLSKTRLAALLNLKPGTDYVLAPPTAMDVPASLSQTVGSLTQQALVNRPELREEDYRKAITELEVKKVFLKYFPSLSFNAGYYRDENRFLVNNDWEAVGWNISWDLLGILGANQERKMRIAEGDVADARRVALSMAVMTQVYLSVSRYELARSRYAVADKLYQIRDRLAKNNRNRGSRASDMDELDTRASALAADMRRSLAFAETQASFARVINSAGIDPVSNKAKSESIGDLARAFDTRWSFLMKGSLLNY